MKRTPSWKKVARRYSKTEAGWLCIHPMNRKYVALFWVSEDKKVRQSFCRLTLNEMLALQAALQASIEALITWEEEDASST